MIPIGERSIDNAERRAISLLFLGMAGFMPIINIVTQVVAFRRVRRTGTAQWDAGKFQVVYENGSAWKYVAAAAFAFLIFSFSGEFLKRAVESSAIQRGGDSDYTEHATIKQPPPSIGIVAPFKQANPSIQPPQTGLYGDLTPNRQIYSRSLYGDSLNYPTSATSQKNPKPSVTKYPLPINPNSGSNNVETNGLGSCVSKPVMTDNDYRACGIIPPGAK